MQVKVTTVEVPPDVSQRPADAAADPQDFRLGLAVVERSAAQGTGMLPAGIYVRAVSGAARRAGIRAGDRILAIDDMAVSNPDELEAALKTVRDDEQVAVLVVRGQITSYVAIQRY
ncbi:PDZ domain-containing protein [Variovorax sp. J22R133]|uniref:PDZ domain-containing protein n=1 Tax=Variovorax brevis TaxID=3053503 RepID=UPI0025755128|nr:PDZ domain-containing protein [Variovorax sp. J22R133]MDM0116365.1 PDZ domain-containing protein [Variovorax sp. J22R133]